MRDRQAGLPGLGPVCRECALAEVCGGGLYAHRHHPATGFDTQSVYCFDLAALITHVGTRIHTELARLMETPPERPTALP
ncbi:hypothetical protein [Streptomyces europaeiscabiei]|uniref:hypothetical protein n=1 Tax=Streptomyces europaeiscabiei TaxID=146819 RepID=UPI002E14323E|nr:hypothetical protein OHB30_08870 [Streptomyces europaeiscabiei]